MIVAALPVALEYTAPSECPARDDFWKSVRHAAPKLRRAIGDEVARHYRVTIDGSGDVFLGELRQADKPEPRTLEASDCSELAEALALMLVLSTEQETNVATASSAATPSTPLPPLPPHDSEAADEQAHRFDPGAKPTALFVGGLGWRGAAPDPLLGVTAGLEHAWGSVVVGRFEARVALANTTADATYVGIAPQVCARWYLRTPELSACAGASFGTLQVKGVEYSGPQSSAWLAPLLSARASAWLGKSVFVELTVEAEYALIERAYFVKRDDTNFATPAFSTLATLGVGARF